MLEMARDNPGWGYRRIHWSLMNTSIVTTLTGRTGHYGRARLPAVGIQLAWAQMSGSCGGTGSAG